MGMDGTPLEDGWSTMEKFNGGPLVFAYDGESLLIDGKPAGIIQNTGGIIVAAQSNSGELIAGVWTYVIHTLFRMIVASEVYGDVFAEGGQIKVRAVTLKCVFGSLN